MLVFSLKIENLENFLAKANQHVKIHKLHYL